MRPELALFHDITPPCDYKPLDQSIGNDVSTRSKRAGVLNLVYVLAELRQFVGSGSYKPTSDTYFPSDGAATYRNSQPAGYLPFPLVFFGYRVPAGQSMRGLLRKEVVSVSKNTGFNRL